MRYLETRHKGLHSFAYTSSHDRTLIHTAQFLTAMLYSDQEEFHSNGMVEDLETHSRSKLRYMPDHKIDIEEPAPSLYPTPYVHIIRWSKIWGCLPVAYNKNSEKWETSGWLMFWCICAIGFNVPTFYDCIKTSVVNDNSLALYVMVLIVGVMSITAVSTHTISMLHHQKWTQFLNNWMKFERKFPIISVGVHSTKLMLPLCFYCCSYVLFFIINVLNELRFNIMNGDGVGRMLSLIYVYVIYSFTLSTPILWVVMNSKIISLCLHHIRRQLDSIVECMSFGSLCSASHVQRCVATGDINRLQDAVLDIARLIEYFKEIMGPLMLVIIPHHIISLICFLYWTIVSMLDYTDWYFPLSFGLLSLQAIAPIFICAIYSEEVENQVRRGGRERGLIINRSSFLICQQYISALYCSTEFVLRPNRSLAVTA